MADRSLVETERFKKPTTQKAGDVAEEMEIETVVIYQRKPQEIMSYMWTHFGQPVAFEERETGAEASQSRRFSHSWR
jgi:hypothetical protein